jgi:hypothetical protein
MHVETSLLLVHLSDLLHFIGRPFLLICQLLALLGRLLALLGRLLAFTARLPALYGRLLSFTGRLLALYGRLLSFTGRLLALTGRLLAPTGRLLAPTGRLPTLSGRLMATFVSLLGFLSKKLGHQRLLCIEILYPQAGLLLGGPFTERTRGWRILCRAGRKYRLQIKDKNAGNERKLKQVYTHSLCIFNSTGTGLV